MLDDLYDVEVRLDFSLSKLGKSQQLLLSVVKGVVEPVFVEGF